MYPLAHSVECRPIRRLVRAPAPDQVGGDRNHADCSFRRSGLDAIQIGEDIRGAIPGELVHGLRRDEAADILGGHLLAGQADEGRLVGLGHRRVMGTTPQDQDPILFRHGGHAAGGGGRIGTQEDADQRPLEIDPRRAATVEGQRVEGTRRELALKPRGGGCEILFGPLVEDFGLLRSLLAAVRLELTAKPSQREFGVHGGEGLKEHRLQSPAEVPADIECGDFVERGDHFLFRHPRDLAAEAIPEVRRPLAGELPPPDRFGAGCRRWGGMRRRGGKQCLQRRDVPFHRSDGTVLEEEAGHRYQQHGERNQSGTRFHRASIYGRSSRVN